MGMWNLPNDTGSVQYNDQGSVISGTPVQYSDQGNLVPAGTPSPSWAHAPTPLWGSAGQYSALEPSYLTRFNPYVPYVDPTPSELVGMRQLGLSPDEYQTMHQATQGSGSMLDPNAAKWSDKWGWITPYDNIKQVKTGDSETLNSFLGLAALATGGALMGGAFAGAGAGGAAGAASAPLPGAAGAYGWTGASGMTAGELSGLGTAGAAGAFSAPMPGSPADYGWGSSSGMTSGELSGAGTSNWLSGAKDIYNTANNAKKVYGAYNAITGANQSETGGNMANSSIGDWASALSPFLSAYNTNNQAGNTADTYDKAYNLITTPSPDQQMYRTQLAQLMSNPGSIESSPVYQAMLDQGTNAVNRTSAAKGMLGSGNRLAELMKVGQDTASKYYFPQVSALSGLSGIQNDSAQRTLGASSLISGQGAKNQMQTSMLSDLMGGFGAQTPEQQFINQLLGKSGTSGTSISNVGSGIADWFNGLNAGNYSEGSSSMPYIDPWASDASTGGTDWSQYLNTPDYTQSNFTVDPSWFA